MSGPFGWDLPPGVTDAMIEAQIGDDHLKECPLHEDNHDGEPAVCECPSEAEQKADATEHRYDMENDR